MTGLWARLAGQERVTAVLRAAAGSPGDAYLFVGPPGVGKEEAARVFAAAVLCREGCGECSTCSRVLRGIHPDVVILEPEGYTYPIEAIRDAVAQAALSPMEGARRIMIVEEADRIAERSQNALLKALEEPNPSVTWVLVSSVLQPVLPTIVSRCQMVEFASVPEEALVAMVRARSSSARSPLTDAEAALVVRASRGDVDLAIALLEDERAAGLRRLAYGIAGEACGPQDPRRALLVGAQVSAAATAAREAREAAAAKELAALEEALGTGRGSGSVRRRLGDRAKRAARRAENEIFVEFCRWLAQAYRDLAALAAGAAPEAVSAPDLVDELAPQAGGLPVASWLRLAEEALDAQAAIRENAQGALSVEALLLAPLALQGASLPMAAGAGGDARGAPAHYNR